jgi:hypothetical protein
MVMALAAPAWARIVKIETAVPQSDPSPETLERALKEALDIIVQGAAAMGFSFIRLDGARILDNSVVVRIVATDDESEDPPGAENLRVSVQQPEAYVAVRAEGPCHEARAEWIVR